MLNLARRPFVNARPVVRVAALLWTVGGILLLANVWLFAGYTRDSAGRQAELELVRNRIAAEEKRIAGLDNEIDRARLPQLALQVQFLNLRIAERTFSWGRVFDRLAEVMPWDVRIVSLSPVSVVPDLPKGKGEVAVPRDRFRISIAGAAQSDDALLRFVDALFKSPYFADPDLHREERRDGLYFDLSVTYIPGGAPAPEEAPVAAASPSATKAAEPRS